MFGLKEKESKKTTKTKKNMDWRRSKFTILAIILQVLFILLFGLLGDYSETARPKKPTPATDDASMYPLFQDVHVMIFIGFGFLMTFLKRYGYGAVSINMLISAFVIQWAFIVRGIIHHVVHGEAKFTVHIGEMLSADFAAATVLISFGAVLGKTSPMQLLIMALIEVVLSQINEWIGLYMLGAVDVGESMYIHAFGAYFGLAVARVLWDDKYPEARGEGVVYHSDIFSMIGTVFLWIFWPSFNGGAASGDEQHRAIINTYLSLCACTVITFAVSQVVDKKGRFTMVHLQNATLAGGVAVGTSANMPLQPFGAMIVGSLAGCLSVVGFQFITPFLNSKLKIHDTCGVNNLHGMPGIFAGIVGAVAAAMATQEGWGETLYEIFPAVIPAANTTAFDIYKANYTGYDISMEPGMGRSSTVQGGFQMLALVVTLIIAIVGGALTGLLLRLPCWDNPAGDDMFDDRQFFEVEAQGFPSNEAFIEDGNETENDVKLRMLSNN